jgi:copper transport protein
MARRRVVAAAALRWCAVAAVLAGLWLFLLAPAAGAHALLVTSSPAANSPLSQSPNQLLLTFSETVDPRLSFVNIMDSSGHPAAGISKAQGVAGNASQLRVTVSSPLTRGVYTVTWQTVSSVDGHVATGSFPFGVGVAAVGSTAPVSGPARTSPWISAAGDAGHWLLYIGLSLLVGASSTVFLVLGGRRPAGSLLLLRLSWLLSIVGVITMFLVERALVHAPSLAALVQSPVGTKLVVLGAFVLVACGTSVLTVGMRPGRWPVVAVGVIAGIAMLLHVWSGHANGASPYRPLILIEQWVHFVAIGAWVGGLVWLLLGMRGQEAADRAVVVRRFSRIATVGIAAVVLTGVLRSISEVGSFGNLVHTTFGATLLVKLGLFALLALLGAVNHFQLVPRLSRSDGALRPFRWTTRGEVMLAAGILVVAGSLSGLAPAASVAAAAKAQAPHQLTATASDYATTVKIHFAATPGTVGQNAFVVAVNDYASGKSSAAAQGVQLQFSLPSDPTMAPTTLTLKKQADGTWQATGLQLAMSGAWRIDVMVQEAAEAVTVPISVIVAAAM